MKQRISKKLFGLGVGPAFLGGAGFGFGAGILSYSILHRYFYVKNLMYEENIDSEDWDPKFYKNFYKRYIMIC